MKIFFRMLFSWFGLFMTELLILYLCGATTIPWYIGLILVVCDAGGAMLLEDDT